MTDGIESRRRELNRLYDELEKLERAHADADLIKECRARTRQLANEITEIERAKDA
jgi:hypothetical protein